MSQTGTAIAWCVSPLLGERRIICTSLRSIPFSVRLRSEPCGTAETSSIGTVSGIYCIERETDIKDTESTPVRVAIKPTLCLDLVLPLDDQINELGSSVLSAPPAGCLAEGHPTSKAKGHPVSRYRANEQPIKNRENTTELGGSSGPKFYRDSNKYC